MAEIMIQFGALADPIEKQLNEYGYTLGKYVEFYEKMLFGLTCAHIHSIISESEYDRALHRFMKHVKKDMKPLKECEGND